MMSQTQLEMYRRMTISERLKLTFDAIRENERFLLYGTPEVVERRFQLLERRNNERNESLLRELRRTRKTT